MWSRRSCAYDNDPYILGMYSFALEETRDFARALELGQQARALSPDDVWALHTLAHVYYETGAFAAGTRLLSEELTKPLAVTLVALGVWVAVAPDTVPFLTQPDAAPAHHLRHP